MPGSLPQRVPGPDARPAPERSALARDGPGLQLCGTTSRRGQTMTRTLIALASAAALIVGAGACKNSGGGSDTGSRTSSGQSPGATDSTSPQGRRGDTLPRARGADAGSDMTTGSSNTTSTPSGSTDTTGSAGATSGSANPTTGSGSTGGTTGSS